MKVCPKCKETSNLTVRSYPCCMERYITLYPSSKELGGREFSYYGSGPAVESSDMRKPKEYVCSKCNYVYKGLSTVDIYDKEMVEEK